MEAVITPESFDARIELQDLPADENWIYDLCSIVFHVGKSAGSGTLYLVWSTVVGRVLYGIAVTWSLMSSHRDSCRSLLQRCVGEWILLAVQ
jgi:hypothetical protein